LSGADVGFCDLDVFERAGSVGGVQQDGGIGLAIDLPRELRRLLEQD
jgi:hypothetical protein